MLMYVHTAQHTYFIFKTFTFILYYSSRIIQMGLEQQNIFHMISMKINLAMYHVHNVKSFKGEKFHGYIHNLKTQCVKTFMLAMPVPHEQFSIANNVKIFVVIITAKFSPSKLLRIRYIHTYVYINKNHLKCICTALYIFVIMFYIC